MNRILVIDDDPSVRHATQLLLECEGFEVVVTAGGRSGVAAARSQSFAAVIVDIYMPDMDGLETIKHLRANNPGLRIIAISGALAGGSSEAPDFLNMATKLWGVKTLHKPFRPSDLMQTIQDVLATPHPENPALQDAQDTAIRAARGASV
jgi:CheY-like chemotaxis protein